MKRAVKYAAAAVIVALIIAVPLAVALFARGEEEGHDDGAEMTVTVRIDCSVLFLEENAEYLSKAVAGSFDAESYAGGIIAESAVKLKGGSTALDALKSACEGSGVRYGVMSGGYVAAIAGLDDTLKLGSSGWLYAVNGVYPSVSAGGKRLKDGDRVTFRYTLNEGDNIEIA